MCYINLRLLTYFKLLTYLHLVFMVTPRLSVVHYTTHFNHWQKMMKQRMTK